MLFESVIFNLLPIIVGILVVAMVFESCWRKCPPDKLMIVSGAGKMRSVSGKGTFVIPLLQRVDTLSLGAVQVQLTTENDIPTQDAILIHACAVANFQIGQTPELIETASKNYLNLDKEEMTRQVTEVMLGKMREVIGQMDLKELMRDRESFNAKVFGCMMPLAWVEDTKAFKVGVFLIWAALVADSVLMGLFYPRELAGVNLLLAAGLESICLICAMYPLHGFSSNLAPCGIRVDTAAAFAFIDFLVTAVGYVSLLLGTIWLIFF